MSKQIEQCFDVGITDQIFARENVDEMSLSHQEKHISSLTGLLIKVP